MLQLQHKNSGKGPLWLVNPKYTVGCKPSSDVKLPKTSQTEVYAELLVDGDELELINLSDDEVPKVNGVPVREKRKLVPGDIIAIGDDELLIVDPKQAKRQTPDASTSGVPKGPVSEWAFEALNTALADKQFPLKKSQTLGRSAECDISLGVVHLSRKHATVTITDSGLLIEDLDSSNGTFVNAKKITRAIAVAGDEVRFDTLKFRVLGPPVSSGKTATLASADNELTTVRPALNPADHGVSEAAKAREPQSKPLDASKTSKPAVKRPHHVSQTQTAISPEVKENKKSSSALVAILLLLMVAGGLGAWFVLGGG